MSAGDEDRGRGCSCKAFREEFLRPLGRFSCDGGDGGCSASPEDALPLARMEVNEGQDQLRPNHGKVVPGVATWVLRIKTTHTVGQGRTVERRDRFHGTACRVRRLRCRRRPKQANLFPPPTPRKGPPRPFHCSESLESPPRRVQ
jgi:hypothetical protein